MTTPDDRTIEDLKTKFPDRELLLLEVEHDGDTYSAVVAVPTKPEWLKFLSDAAAEDTGKRIQAQENLVLALAKWPEREQLQDLFKRRVAIVSEFATEITKAAGLSAKASVKKL